MFVVASSRASAPNRKELSPLQQQIPSILIPAPARPRPAAWRRRKPGRLRRLSAVPLLAVVAGAPLGLSALHPIDRAAAATVTQPGSVAAFGDAAPLGGPGAGTTAPVVGLAATPSGQGYWVVAADGGVFTYGDATFHGSLPAQSVTDRVAAMAATASGNGYWLAGASGTVHAFGDAPDAGSLSGPSPGEVVGLAPTPDAAGYWALEGPPRLATAAAVPLGTFTVTCYDLPGHTATGAPTGPETVAVDPAVVPLGTHLVVDGAGPRVATDTGAAVRGRHLDIWEPTAAACAAWGVQTRQVWETP